MSKSDESNLPGNDEAVPRPISEGSDSDLRSSETPEAGMPPKPESPQQLPGSSVPLTKANVAFLYVDPALVPPLPDPVATIVRCVKPANNVAIRVHPDPTVSRIVMLREVDRELWVVPLVIVNTLRATTIPDIDRHVNCTLLRPYITNKSSLMYLWPLKRESAISVGENGYNKTADLLATVAEKEWIRLSTDIKEAIYKGYPPDDVMPERNWPPDIDIDDLIVRAFGNRIAGEVDHFVFKGLHTKGAK